MGRARMVQQFWSRSRRRSTLLCIRVGIKKLRTTAATVQMCQCSSESNYTVNVIL